MNETDKLIAAIFAATMTVKETTPTLQGFFAFYDACAAAIRSRADAAVAARIRDKRDADDKMWEAMPVFTPAKPTEPVAPVSARARR